jgi:molybdate transport system substrate-binding protein
VHRALVVVLCLSLGPVTAEEVRVAVASNFAPALNRIAADHRRTTGDRLRISSGSTGKLYAQIVGGAPFDILLAADSERPRLLEQNGFAVAGSRFTYAVGRLVLWSNDPDVGQLGIDGLRRDGVRRIALANPRTAPYGAAARQVLERSGLWETLGPRLVFGENVAQAFQFVSTGNADAGFVALSQLGPLDGSSRGSRWIVPRELQAGIEQQAVLLVRDDPRPAADRFLDYLRSAKVRDRLGHLGYPVD